MLRKISAVLVGVVVSIGTVTAVQWLGHQVYPLPPGMDFSDPEQVLELTTNMPPGAFLFVLLAWFLGTVVGGLAACWVAREQPVIFASIIGTFMLIATIANLMMIPHPTWFSIAALILIAAGTLLAARWSSNTGHTTRPM
jgi:hypothetical protein